MPKIRKDFWEKKFETNKERDQSKISELRKRGWKVKVVWECQLRGNSDHVLEQVSAVAEWLKCPLEEY